MRPLTAQRRVCSVPEELTEQTLTQNGDVQMTITRMQKALKSKSKIVLPATSVNKDISEFLREQKKSIFKLKNFVLGGN